MLRIIGKWFRFRSRRNSVIISSRSRFPCLDPPRVGPYEFPNDLQVGMKARAMCSVMQGDAPFKFAWSQDGRRIESDVATKESGAIFKVQTLRDYSMLTVDSLTLAHAGNITCLVSNDGSQTWQSAMLKVNGKWMEMEEREFGLVPE